MNILLRLFSGRISRSQFLISGLLILVLPILLVLASVAIIAKFLMSFIVAVIIHNFLALILLIVIFLTVGLYVRRLHDMNWPGWIVLFQMGSGATFFLCVSRFPALVIMNIIVLIAVIFLNALLLLIVFILPGTKESNRYGDRPQTDRAIQNIIFNRKGSSAARGEKWLAWVLFMLSVFGMLLYVILQTNLPTSFGLTPFYPDVVFDVNGKLASVPRTDLKVLCGSEDFNIKNAPAFPNLENALPNLVSQCGGDSDAILLYGSNNVYDIFLRNNSWFSLSQRYLIVLSRKDSGQGDLNDYALGIYTTSPDFKDVYNEDLGVVSNLQGSPGDDISFKDINGDGKTDLQICLPAMGGSGCRTYVAQPTSNTFVRWMSAESDINSSYAVEGDTIYYNDTAMEGVDLSSFSIINDQYAKDDHNAYLFGKIITDVDGPSFEVVDQGEGGDYTKDKNGVYLSGQSIPGADPATFAYIAGDYTKDKNNVYQGADQIIGADPATFQVLSEPSNMYKWSKDKNHVYYDGTALDNVFPQYFQAESADFGTDGLNVFYGIRAIPSSRADTFTMVQPDYPSYAKDANQVYFGGAVDSNPVIIGADPATFAVVGENYSKDSQHVFYQLTTITGADPLTIIYIGDANGSEYAKDKNFVYRDGEAMPDTNPATFTIY